MKFRRNSPSMNKLMIKLSILLDLLHKCVLMCGHWFCSANMFHGFPLVIHVCLFSLAHIPSITMVTQVCVHPQLSSPWLHISLHKSSSSITLVIHLCIHPHLPSLWLPTSLPVSLFSFSST